MLCANPVYMRLKKIYAIVISFNPNIKLLDEEYGSIAPQVDKIIYIDNLSTNRNEIKTWIEGKEKASIIWMSDNEGIGIAQNAGMHEALKDGASHVVIFDQDSVVEQNFVAALYEAEQRALAEGVQVGLTGPIYSSHDDGYLYPIVSIRDGHFIKIPIDCFTYYCPVSHIIASGSLIRRETLEQVGMMREDYFIGYVDFEYCFRAAQKGFACIVTKEAMMRHQMGDRQVIIAGRKIGVYSPFRRYFDCRNTMLIQHDNTYPLVFRRHYLKLIIAKFLFGCLYGPHRWLQLRYCLKGFIDGLKGISGKINK